MSINRTVVKSWIATVVLHNGQTLEIEVRGKSIALCRDELKKDSQIKTVVGFKKDFL